MLAFLTRFAALVRLKDVVTCRGRVVGKSSADDLNLVELEVWAENQKTEKVVTGRATVAGVLAAPWIVLDGDPVWFHTPIDFHFLPEAIRTFTFAAECRSDDRHASHDAFDAGPQHSWNDDAGSGVAISEQDHRSGYGKPQEVRPC